LDAQGYQSIGCEPCTRKMDLEMMERQARWYGMNKTECGLHTDLVKSEK
jgi:phosphoadenosine phosphosulfate reductase